MAEHLKGMKDAMMGQGGGLQETSTAVGETIAGNSDMRGGKSKSVDEASASLGQFENGTKGGKTTAGTSIKGEDQVKNMQTGAADHLNMGFRK